MDNREGYTPRHSSWYQYFDERSARAEYARIRARWVRHTGNAARTFDRHCSGRVEAWIAADIDGDAVYTEAGQRVETTPTHRLYVEAADQELAHGLRLRRAPAMR